jgi:hypothetical protein
MHCIPPGIDVAKPVFHPRGVDTSGQSTVRGPVCILLTALSAAETHECKDDLRAPCE